MQEIDDNKEFMCDNHNDIKEYVGKIKEIIKKHCINLEVSDINTINYYLDIITERVKMSNYQGVRMENRLKKYRTSIEKLGFVRVDENGC